MTPPIRKILCQSNRADPRCNEAAEGLVSGLREAGFEVTEQAEEIGLSRPDLILVLGGDGFLMETLRRLDYPTAPFFGINFGTVGFLMNRKGCLPRLIPMIRERSFQEEEHAILAGKVKLEDGSEIEAFAFNDFVIERMTRQSIRLTVHLDGNPFNRFAGDGLVVSTAAGSTAYNLAAGGPVVHPGIQAMVITPLYPHRASPFHSLQFSLLVPLRSRLGIQNEETPKRRMRVVADGRLIEKAKAVDVENSGRKVTLLRPMNHIFVHTLSKKFIGG